MSIFRAIFAILLLVVMSFSSVGQETEPEADAEAAPPAAEAPPPAAEAPPPAAEAPPPDTRPLDEIFIPSEEIAADEEVVFPVNI